jgi:hypothetical protein
VEKGKGRRMEMEMGMGGGNEYEKMTSEGGGNRREMGKIVTLEVGIWLIVEAKQAQNLQFVARSGQVRSSNGKTEEEKRGVCVFC